MVVNLVVSVDLCGSSAILQGFDKDAVAIKIMAYQYVIVTLCACHRKSAGKITVHFLCELDNAEGADVCSFTRGWLFREHIGVEIDR